MKFTHLSEGLSLALFPCKRLKKAILFTLVLLLSCCVLHAQTITTVAGNGSATPFTVDGIAATSTTIGAPGKVVSDNFGNFFIVTDARIRRVDAVTGTITTYAGNGITGFSGDGGPATLAAVVAGYIAIDDANNIYLSDNSNHRIRKINAATGLISTVVGNGIAAYSGDGGAATAASLKDPTGIAVDVSGHIYIADSFRIRKVNVATGIIDAYAGTGLSSFSGDGGAALSAAFNDIQGIAVDLGGNLYIADYANRRIRRVSSVGVVSTVAGSGLPGTFTGDGVAATSAQIYPRDVAVDAVGRIFIGESVNERARMVDFSGIIHTVAGNGTSGYSGDGSAATDAQLNQPVFVAPGHCDGNLYVSDVNNYRVRKVDFSGLPAVCTCTPSLVLVASPGDTVCPGASVTYTATLSSGGSATTYQWFVNGSVVSTTGSTHTYSPADADVIRCEATTSGGACSGSVTVSSNSIFMVLLAVSPVTGDLSACVGNTTILSSSPLGGTWSSGNTAIATVGAASGIVTGVAAGTAFITYAPGGSCTTTAIVTVHPLPLAGTITGAANLCPGASVTLTNSAAGGTWISSNPVVATIASSTGIMKSVTPGTSLISYTVGPDVNGCSAAAVVTVNVITNSFTLTGAVTDVLCHGGSTGTIELAAIPADSAYSYTWSHGATGATATGLADGSYSVVVTQTGTQCSRTARFDVAMPDTMFVQLLIKHSICRYGGTLKAEAMGGISPYDFLWTSKDTVYAGDDVEPVPAASYTLSVTDANGCAYTQDFNLIETGCNTVFISGGYSPNGDGNSDLWSISGLQEYPLNTVQVFDKWGDIVYEQTRYQNDWDGTKKGGGRLPDGTYFYLVKLNEPSKTGGDNVFKGTVLIKR